jgi:purine nucleosidase/ribosylpyrimidine nucleosidase
VTSDPRIVDAVDEIVVMGGTSGPGSITASAETNMWHDPLAAHAVLTAGFGRLVLIPLDATLSAQVSATDCDRLRLLGTRPATLAAELIEARIVDYRAGRRLDEVPAAPVHDALAVAFLVRPEVVSLRAAHVDIDVGEAITVGRTVIDVRPGGARVPNAEVALDADRDAFVGLLVDVLGTSSHIVG